MGVALVALRLLAHPPPDEDSRTLVDVSDQYLIYQCVGCGMEIRVLKRPEGRERAPRHCGEPMELVAPRQEAP